jgi:hypothetical protein
MVVGEVPETIMPIERVSAATAVGVNVVDVLDRVLDKGIVIDAWVRVSLVGIDLITVEARVVVASIATYLQFSGDLAQAGAASTPGNGRPADERKYAYAPVGRLGALQNGGPPAKAAS